MTLMEAGSSAQLQLLLKRAVNERQQKRVGGREGGKEVGSCTYASVPSITQPLLVSDAGCAQR